MTTHRSPLTRAAALAVAALALSAPLAACSSDDDEGDTSTESTEAATDDTMDEMTDDTMDEMSDDTMADDEMEDEEATGEIGTTELLDFLNGEDEEIGALFDWNTGDGVIAVTYLGTQTVQLYAAETDAAQATQACELASEYVFEMDETAIVEVYTGGYDNATLLVSRTGVDGVCAPV